MIPDDEPAESDKFKALARELDADEDEARCLNVWRGCFIAPLREWSDTTQESALQSLDVHTCVKLRDAGIPRSHRPYVSI